MRGRWVYGEDTRSVGEEGGCEEEVGIRGGCGE